MALLAAAFAHFGSDKLGNLARRTLSANGAIADRREGFQPNTSAAAAGPDVVVGIRVC